MHDESACHTADKTLTSHAWDANERWRTTPEYSSKGPPIVPDKFLEITNLLFENPNLNSTHLFRADILFDSAHLLRTKAEKEARCRIQHVQNGDLKEEAGSAGLFTPRLRDTIDSAALLDGYTLVRTVIRRLIPRKPQLDRPMDQTCQIYRSDGGSHLVVYVPHVEEEKDMPWYHPPVRALAYLHEVGQSTTQGDFRSSISIHYVLFSDYDVPPRLHRTFLSLLQTFVRLAKTEGSPGDNHSSISNNNPIERSTAPLAIKDTIIPQHIVQDTYTRLKYTYAADLISRWVEKTEPSKHVFEDLSIAAFLIEIWRQMYTQMPFPGFVDVACGNGVLAYVLIKEGYRGCGFDARRRRTWAVLGIDEFLDERICVPKPFLDAAAKSDLKQILPDKNFHDGIFPLGTFIISNHADELTPWTPILAALSSPGLPLPFLAIPCCSHALSGAKHRYSPKDVRNTTDAEEQLATGDLRALRAAKVKAANHADDKSMYACLTKKVMAIAEEIGFDVEMTLMRIPSTRNIGLVGNRLKDVQRNSSIDEGLSSLTVNDTDILEKIQYLVERECKISGGLQPSSRTWIERAQTLQTGKGRGKVNLGGKRESG